jgi:hypothetical protein
MKNKESHQCCVVHIRCRPSKTNPILSLIREDFPIHGQRFGLISVQISHFVAELTKRALFMMLEGTSRLGAPWEHSMKRTASTQTSKFIRAPRETVYRAFTDPAALGRVWLVPGQMTGKMYEFELCVGGGCQMSFGLSVVRCGKPGQNLGEGRPLYRTVHRT